MENVINEVYRNSIQMETLELYFPFSKFPLIFIFRLKSSPRVRYFPILEKEFENIPKNMERGKMNFSGGKSFRFSENYKFIPIRWRALANRNIS